MKKRIALICLMIIGMMLAAAAASAGGVIETSDYTIRSGNSSTVMNVRITVNGTVAEVVPCVIGETESQLRVLMLGAQAGDYKKSKLDGKCAKVITFEKVDEQCSEAVIDFAQTMRVEECRTEIQPQANGKSVVVLTIRLGANGEEVRGLKGKTILLDAGHGGTDCGAIGASGIYEKDVTLAITKELHKQLMAEDANVVMTRTTDCNVSGIKIHEEETELGARVTVAERTQADIFVSIHLNSFTEPDTGGVETYYCQGSFAGERLAYAVQKSLMDQFDLQDRGVKTAKFYVLRHSTMPTILTELAFISNPREEQLLISPDAQKLFAAAILKGLKEYFST